MAIKRLPSTGDAPRSTGVPESLVPGGAADSAGFPWAGRTFDSHETQFADDDGSTPREFRDAVEAVRRTTEDPKTLATAIADAIIALSRCRLLVPLLAEAGDVGLTPEGKLVDKTQELSIVTVAAPDGRRAMPVFSSVEAMRAWNSEARPIPVAGPQLALAAAEELNDLIIVDPGSPESEFGVRRTQLEALAMGRHVLPAWADPGVLAAFRAAATGEPSILGVALAPGDPACRLLTPEVDVILTLQEGLERPELSAILAAFQERLAADEVVAARVDSMRVTVRGAGSPARN